MPELKKASPEKTYRQIILDARKRQLRLSATAVERLRITFDAAVESLKQKIESLPEDRIGTPWHRAMLQLISDSRTVLEGLEKDYTTLMDLGMVELAQNAADRELEVSRLVNAPDDPSLFPTIDQALRLTNGQEIPVQFGRLALGAVERVTTRYYRDGLKLSDRIHNLTAQSRKVLENTITQGLIEQISAKEMAKRLQLAMAEQAQDGLPPPRHVAMRIARTEIRHAHSEAFVMASQQSPGVLKDFISGLRWNLSLSHREPDQCDLYATRDGGMGPGIYEPQEFPTSHPHCLCYGTDVLKDFPDSGVGGATPKPDDVSPSHRRAFAEEFPQAEGALVPA